MATLAVEVAEEVVVVIGGDRPRLGPRLPGASAEGRTPRRSITRIRQYVATANSNHHQQDLQHVTSVGPGGENGCRREILGTEQVSRVDAVKEFVVYTGLRLLMFVATFGIVVGVWLLVADRRHRPAVVIVVSFVVSGVGSYFLLGRPGRLRTPGRGACRAGDPRLRGAEGQGGRRLTGRCGQRLRLICR